MEGNVTRRKTTLAARGFCQFSCLCVEIKREREKGRKKRRERKGEGFIKRDKKREKGTKKIAAVPCGMCFLVSAIPASSTTSSGHTDSRGRPVHRAVIKPTFCPHRLLPPVILQPLNLRLTFTQRAHQTAHPVRRPRISMDMNLTRFAYLGVA